MQDSSTALLLWASVMVETQGEEPAEKKTESQLQEAEEGSMDLNLSHSSLVTSTEMLWGSSEMH